MTESHSNDDLAVLREGSLTYFARSPKGCPPFLSAPSILLQGIYSNHSALARRIVRHRIFTTLPSSRWLHGMIKVAAKRVTTGLAPDAAELELRDPWQEFFPDTNSAPELERSLPTDLSRMNDQERMKLATGLVASIPRQPLRYLSDRPIAAILVSSEGRLLSAALNMNARNRIRHAEINLIENYWRKSGELLPAASTIYTSLKPCKMCAGMILDCAIDPNRLQVIYGEDDPGTNARNTALDQCSHRVQRPVCDWDEADQASAVFRQ